MAKKIPAIVDLGDELTKTMATTGLDGFFQRATDRTDMEVLVTSTGLPRLDKFLHDKKCGLPHGKNIEVYSKDPEVGKTSISLQIASAWQKQGKKVCIIDVEGAVDNPYLELMGFDMSEGKAPHVAKGYDPDTGEILPAETILGHIITASNLFDLVLVDSIGALVKRADLEKDVGSSGVGGVSKPMWDMFRKTTHMKATIIWVNQALPQIGGYNPSGVTKYKTGGGNALPFSAAIRLELRLKEKLKRPIGKDKEEVYGVVISVLASKNKVSDPYNSIDLTYLNGEGFSATWDLFRAGLEAKVIEKSGSWFSFQGERLGQGELNAYELLKSTPDLQQKVKDALTNVESV